MSDHTDHSVRARLDFSAAAPSSLTEINRHNPDFRIPPTGPPAACQAVRTGGPDASPLLTTSALSQLSIHTGSFDVQHRPGIIHDHWKFRADTLQQNEAFRMIRSTAERLKSRDSICTECPGVQKPSTLTTSQNAGGWRTSQPPTV